MLQKSGRQGLWTLAELTNRELELAILRLLGSRGLGATVTLREAALAVGGESWRSLLERAEFVAGRLAAHRLVEIVRSAGEIVGGDLAGTRVRLGRRRSRAALPPSLLN